MNDNNIQLICTADISLAAYLHSEGFKLHSVDTSNFPTKFHFLKESEKLDDCVHLHDCGQAVGNIVQFYRSYKLMISKLKDGNGNGNGNGNHLKKAR